ncbi:hypothetical protein R1flu_020358 [Riccia fluitans]|uniref:Uncharacterized protein n=1 Tax=Riccia fluitans TaxID=41844 RepID=A0ABD1ZLA6_9MARC
MVHSHGVSGAGSRHLSGMPAYRQGSFFMRKLRRPSTKHAWRLRTAEQKHTVLDHNLTWMVTSLPASVSQALQHESSSWQVDLTSKLIWSPGHGFMNIVVLSFQKGKPPKHLLGAAAVRKKCRIRL